MGRAGRAPARGPAVPPVADRALPGPHAHVGRGDARVARLERAGLVTRLPDPADGRGLLVELTEAGRALVDRVAPLHLERERELLAPLTPAEQEELAGLLRRLLAHFEAEQPVPPRRRKRGGPPQR